MKTLSSVRFIALFFITLVVVATPAWAQPLLTPVPKAPRHNHNLPIAEQLQTLITGPAPQGPVAPAIAAPALPAPAAPANQAAPATAQPATAADDNADTEPQETFGTKALNFVITEGESLRAQGDGFISSFTAMPELSNWLNQQSSDTRRSEMWSRAGNDLLFIVGLSFLGSLIIDLLFLPVRNHLRSREPKNTARRIGLLFAVLGVNLIPIVFFIGISLALLGQNETHRFPRFVALNAVYALALSRIALALIGAFLSPRSESLRLIHASPRQALYAYRWLALYSFVIIYGYFFVDVARAIHCPQTALSAFNNLLGLILVVMTLVVIIQKRAFVATLLRGNLSAAQRDLTLFQGLRLWFARHWHVLAIAYIVIGYLITALGVENGLALLLRGTILTLILFTVMRLLFHVSDRWGMDYAGSSMHQTIVRMLLRCGIWIFAVIAIAASWGANIPAFFATPLGQRLLGAAFSIGITVIIVAVIYSICDVSIERRLNRRDEEGKTVGASARMRTLLPMVRNAIFIVFTVIVGLVVMSEAGLNIGPLLAGAGIFGVAIGFGSQTLVKDFLTGLFIVIENTIAIGDVVKIGDHSGVVENMNIRTMRLRDNDGALHILPYSEVTKIVNMTKDFAFAAFSISVAYHSDLDHVMRVIRSVGDELQNDPVFKRAIVEPMEVLGVDNLGDSAIKLAARIRTRPGKQWDVKRQFLLKLKQRFDKEGIEIPFPTVTNIQRTLPSS